MFKKKTTEKKDKPVKAAKVEETKCSECNGSGLVRPEFANSPVCPKCEGKCFE